MIIKYVLLILLLFTSMLSANMEHQSLYNKAMSVYVNHDFVKSEKMFLEVLSKDNLSKHLKANASFKLSKLYIKNDQLDKALKYAKLSYESEYNILVLNNITSIYFKVNKVQELQKYFIDILDLYPENDQPYLLYITIASNNNWDIDYEKYINYAKSIAQDMSKVLKIEAFYYFKNKNYDRSLKAIDQFLKNKYDKDYTIYMLKGKSLLNIHNYDDSELAFLEVLKLTDNKNIVTEAVLNITLLYYIQGMYHEALSVIDDNRPNINVNNNDCTFLLANIYLALKKPGLARPLINYLSQLESFNSKSILMSLKLNILEQEYFAAYKTLKNITFKNIKIPSHTFYTYSVLVNGYFYYKSGKLDDHYSTFKKNLSKLQQIKKSNPDTYVYYINRMLIQVQDDQFRNFLIKYL